MQQIGARYSVCRSVCSARCLQTIIQALIQADSGSKSCKSAEVALMVKELAHEILRQANALDLMQRERAADSSKAVLKIWYWRCKPHSEVNTEFQRVWGLQRSKEHQLVLTAPNFQFTKNTSLVAHLFPSRSGARCILDPARSA